MDLLKGYGSDSSASLDSNSLSVAITKSTPVPASAAVAASVSTVPKAAAPTRAKVGGKRILSLGAVLPAEIFDRLTRHPDDDSSTSSSENERSRSKKRKRRNSDNDVIGKKSNEHDSAIGNSGNRAELNSLLNELRSTPLHVSDRHTSSKNGSSMKNKHSQTLSSHGNELGLAFMSYTTSTTSASKNNEIVDIHAIKATSKLPITSNEGEGNNGSQPTPTATAIPTFSRKCTAAPISSFAHQAQQQSQHYEPPLTMSIHPTQSEVDVDTPSIGENITTQSRKQRREEERALRSGQAFIIPTSAVATEIHQPSPTEFAPTAHAAAIASNAARHRGAASGTGGHSSVKNIAMYDPQSGGDVKGLGVTGKHRSKHQINQLMASAISLEAHRASEAELARFGMGGGGESGKGSRADAKRKYGW